MWVTIGLDAPSSAWHWASEGPTQTLGPPSLTWSPTESCDLLGDIQTCIKKSLGEKPRRTRSKATNPQEPPWVEVLVEILLALLAQPSHLMRQVARSVFGHICSHLTPCALQLILDVLNPEESQDEDDNVVVTDDSEHQLLGDAEDESSDDSEDKGNEDSESEEESNDEESDEEDRDGDVDQGFREQLRAVLQSGKALGGADGEDDDELGDEAMMALDKSLASLFAEQKLRIQARRDEKNKLQKEKALRRGFQIRVLDLIEVLVTKQPENPLVLEVLEPLLHIIRRSMRTSSTKQEQDLLHKTARIFMHHLCRSRHYCRNVGDRVETLYTQLERLVQQAGRQADSSVCLYYFNASLYLLRVLKGNAVGKSTCKAQKKEKAGADAGTQPQGPEAASCLDLSLVTPIYSSALSAFLTKRSSPLTAPMFLSLFSRHPMLCKNLLPIVVEHVASHTRPRHQAQACLLLQKTLPTRELRRCFKDPEWEQLLNEILVKVTEKLTMDLTAVLGVLQSQQPRLQQGLQQGAHSAGSSRLYDLYWQAMKFLGVQYVRGEGAPTLGGAGKTLTLHTSRCVHRSVGALGSLGTTDTEVNPALTAYFCSLPPRRPKSEKDAREAPKATPSPISMKRKKKGFLPETKKRKKRKSEGATQEEAAEPVAAGGDQPPSTGKRKRKIKRKGPAQSQAHGLPASKSPTPDPPAMSPSSPTKTPKPQKKTRKLSQVSRATPVSPESPKEPAAKKRQKNLPQKGVSGKSPQSALPRRKARLSLASRSPSLLQSGARKKGQLRKAKKL
ncbi:myb-binding protein 1A [Pontoporia blainvillei]|uniref:Myb-binding protein 1A n=1 Tax=Pontoporia blainvillei TaxID=48723 RepID=A0ABX0S481_PONBL|nr:myb-binding protein 1A [Pontoporia blainvillei]